MGGVRKRKGKGKRKGRREGSKGQRPQWYTPKEEASGQTESQRDRERQTGSNGTGQTDK